MLLVRKIKVPPVWFPVRALLAGCVLAWQVSLSLIRTPALLDWVPTFMASLNLLTDLISIVTWGVRVSTYEF